MVIAVPVIVRVAVRSGPVFAATANWTVPFPAPDAPCVTVRKPALLTAVQLHVLGVVTEMDADPPVAGKVVVVTPVMIWQELTVTDWESLPHPAAINKAAATRLARVRRKKDIMIMAAAKAHFSPARRTAWFLDNTDRRPVADRSGARPVAFAFKLRSDERRER
jgi:hypothetical protein